MSADPDGAQPGSARNDTGRDSGSEPASDGADAGTAEAVLTRPLPDVVRTRVIGYGSDVLGGLPAAELPSALRRVARFEPRRRARLAGPQIAAQLESDSGFRGKVAERVQRTWPELVEELRRGVVPPAAEPVEVAAAAYILRPPGWVGIVDRIQGELEHREVVKEHDEAAETIAELREQIKSADLDHREEANRLRSELRASRRTIADLRRSLHVERQKAKEALARSEAAVEETAEHDAAVRSQISTVEAENRRLRNRLAAAETQVETARKAARTGRSVDDARLRVLIDVLMDSAHGLRRELALPTAIERPADLVADEGVERRSSVPGGGLPDDDPGLVDQLLTLPRVHMLVDGYNVTKTGYATLPLADQRTRLLTSLEGLASRTKAEITCVFDGAEVEAPVGLSASRRVRLLFSDPEETADELIIRLVRAEPSGRPLTVVTSDREIITAVRRAGARTVPSVLLLRRLEASP